MDPPAAGPVNPSHASDEPVIHVRDLRMRYGAHNVLVGVDFDIHSGEVVCLLGPNGAGKSTTIEILEGFRDRSDGLVSVLGKDPIRATEDWRARVGVVLQSWRDHPRWTSRRLLTHLGGFYAPYATPMCSGRTTSTSCSMWSASPSSPIRRSPPSRVGNDAASMWRPASSGVPSCCSWTSRPRASTRYARRAFHELVHRLSELEHTTILLTTHDLAEAEKLSDRILILAGGRIASDGSAEQLARERGRRSGGALEREAASLHLVRIADSTAFVRGLFAEHGEEIEDLEVRRASLEDTYMTLVQRHENERRAAAEAEAPGMTA